MLEILTRVTSCVSMATAAKKQQKPVNDLDGTAKKRYLSKLSVIGGQDPYEILSWSEDPQILPKITYPDIVNYLIFSPSPYTMDDLKSYKSLEAYNYFVSGWVRERKAVELNDRVLVISKV